MKRERGREKRIEKHIETEGGKNERTHICVRLTQSDTGTGKGGHYERGVPTEGLSRISIRLTSRNCLESLDNGWILLCFPQSRGSLKSTFSRIFRT